MQNYLHKNQFKDDKKGRKKILSKSLDLFKTTEDEKTLNTKTSKKMFVTQRQNYSKVEETKKKKVFPIHLHQQTLSDLKEDNFIDKPVYLKKTIKVNVDTYFNIRMYYGNLQIRR